MPILTDLIFLAELAPDITLHTPPRTITGFTSMTQLCSPPTQTLWARARHTSFSTSSESLGCHSHRCSMAAAARRSAELWEISLTWWDILHGEDAKYSFWTLYGMFVTKWLALDTTPHSPPRTATCLISRLEHTRHWPQTPSAKARTTSSFTSSPSSGCCSHRCSLSGGSRMVCWIEEKTVWHIEKPSMGKTLNIPSELNYGVF